jgi:hypothetical protein
MNALCHNRVTAWIALAAVLFAAVSPSHARWAAHPAADLAAEVCSASGNAYPASPDGAGAPPVSHSQQDHCWFCSTPAKSAAAVNRGPAFGVHAPGAEPPLPDAPALVAGPAPLLTPPPRAPPRLA